MTKAKRNLKRERRRERKAQRKEWKRSGKFNRHHIKNRVAGGQSIAENLLRMDIRRHQAFHLLFGNMSFREVAELLLRTCEMKGQED